MTTTRAAETSRMTVLFVDDDPLVLRSYARLLLGSGFRILTAPSAEQALRLLETEKVDLVVSDERMPRMRGIDFLTRVKERFPHIKRSLLTGFAELSVALDAVNRAEVTRILRKPFGIRTLQRELATMLKGGAHLRRAEELLSLEQEFPGIGTIEHDESGRIKIE